MMKSLLVVSALFAINGFNDSDLIKARDRQDKAALEKMVGDLKPAADKDQKDAVAQYRLALAESYSAEVAIETHDKPSAKNALGGGYDLAIKDFRKAIELDGKNADAYLWLGIALRKVNQPDEARKAIAKSLELNPNRLWAKQQLDKTPTN